jgi:hypothetical protein
MGRLKLEGRRLKIEDGRFKIDSRLKTQDGRSRLDRIVCDPGGGESLIAPRISADGEDRSIKGAKIDNL